MRTLPFAYFAYFAYFEVKIFNAKGRKGAAKFARDSILPPAAVCYVFNVPG
jgi:hypothetical protein